MYRRIRHWLLDNLDYVIPTHTRGVQKLSTWTWKLNLMVKFTSLVFNVVPRDCNLLYLLRLQLLNTLRKKWNILGVRVLCYSFHDCTVIGKSSSMQKFFKVSEEKVVTGSQIWTEGRMVTLYGRAQTNLAKLLLAKALLLKCARTSFLLLKIWLAHTNRAKSKSTFEHVLACATSKMLSAKTCQNVLESIFAFCSIDVHQSYL